MRRLANVGDANNYFNSKLVKKRTVETEYTIIIANTIEELELRVNDKLQQGFVCMGAPIINLNRQIHHQAVIKVVTVKKVRTTKKQKDNGL